MFLLPDWCRSLSGINLMENLPLFIIIFFALKPIIITEPPVTHTLMGRIITIRITLDNWHPQTRLMPVPLIVFVSQTSCKSAVAFFQFSILANYFWLLVEGMYLQTLLALTFVFQKKYFWWYILIGWGGCSADGCSFRLNFISVFVFSLWLFPNDQVTLFVPPRCPNNNHNGVDPHTQLLWWQRVSCCRRISQSMNPSPVREVSTLLPNFLF